MQVFIEIVAMDHENGLKKTVTATVDVPRAVLQLHEMFSGNDAGKLVTVIANAAMSGAQKELDAGRRNKGAALNEQVERGGKVGGPARAGAPDPMAEALGLDVIQRMSAGERQQPRQPAPRQPAPAAQHGPPIPGFPDARR